VEELDVNKKCKLVYGRDIKDSHNSTVGALLSYFIIQAIKMHHLQQSSIGNIIKILKK
jgi:hypothetical protein